MSNTNELQIDMALLEMLMSGPVCTDDEMGEGVSDEEERHGETGVGCMRRTQLAHVTRRASRANEPRRTNREARLTCLRTYMRVNIESKESALPSLPRLPRPDSRRTLKMYPTKLSTGFFLLFPAFFFVLPSPSCPSSAMTAGFLDLTALVPVEAGPEAVVLLAGVLPGTVLPAADERRERGCKVSVREQGGEGGGVV
jgi:hypothetical protein